MFLLALLLMNPFSYPPQDIDFINPQEYVLEIPDGIPDGECWIEIDLSDQLLFLNNKSEILRVYQISSGKDGMDTKQGLFRIYAKYVEYPMWGPDYHTPDVPYTMFFHNGFAIHGAYWHDDFGTPVSHGCVNMRVSEAKALYEKVPKWTYVYVHE
jgi:lipoprotein-anchoring transpeptidase ErfK/SrfK